MIEPEWSLDGQIIACPKCGREYRLWGTESYVEATGECDESWALTAPDGENPWL